MTAAWLATVAFGAVAFDDMLALFGRPAQLGLVAVGAGAALVLARRLDHLDVRTKL